MNNLRAKLNKKVSGKKAIAMAAMIFTLLCASVPASAFELTLSTGDGWLSASASADQVQPAKQIKDIIEIPQT